MEFKVNFGLWGSIFAVPTKLIDRHIKLCSELQLKVLLMALRYGEDVIDTHKIANTLSLTVENVEDCLSYWETTDIFQSTTSHTKTETKILREGEEKLDIETTETYKKNDTKKKTEQEHKKDTASSVPMTTTINNKNDKDQVIKIQHSRAKLSPAQIHEMSLTDPNISILTEELQLQLAKPISPTELEEFIYYYVYMNLDPEYMLMVVAYCIQNGKNSMYSIITELKTWVENGIDTLESAENYIILLDNRNTNNNEVKSMFKIERNLTLKEKDCIIKWYEEFGYDAPIIELAYERATKNEIPEKSIIAYVNTTLENWNKNGVRTIKQAIEESTKYDKNNTNSKINTSKLDKTTGMNSFDINDIEKVFKSNMGF